ncbi:uncharacterized serine-rich protein C215.13-like [Salvia splendens]|uniref:uncharacterized serine-rich protein C215.13-like n=1 Tax=Salvia splendens TaxID=180675 RepID=UPI001C26776B|nr:uncharacterized serine-rich protein C215.13-like [Salvia splendens]
MDRSSGKRGAGGSLTPRKNYSLTAFKGVARGDDDAQFCNRIGCSGRVKFGQNARVRISDTSKYSKSSFHSSSGTGKTPRSNSTMTNAKRSCLDSKRKGSSQVTSDPLETSLSTESKAQRIVPTQSNLSGYKSVSVTKSKEVNMTEAGSSSASTSVAPQKTFRCKSGSNNQRSTGTGMVCRIRDACNSISDAIPPSCSQPEPASVRKNFIKKRSSEGETSSSCRGRKNAASANEDKHTSTTTSGISISDLAHSTSAYVEDSSVSSSSWNRRSTNVNARMRFSSQLDARNGLSVREPPVSFSEIDYETPFDVGDRSGSRPHRDNLCSRTSFASDESGLTQLMNHDVLHQFNMDGIAEVLMALERIQQDEDLTHEQILALEIRLFLHGLNLYDQHRYMRLDIDNMSYEELLALEERMGTVSTALLEEALSKCVTRSVYETTTSNIETTESGCWCTRSD